MLLWKRIELTVEQGKILEERELKHDLQEKLRTPADTESLSARIWKKINRDDLAMKESILKNSKRHGEWAIEWSENAEQ